VNIFLVFRCVNTIFPIYCKCWYWNERIFTSILVYLFLECELCECECKLYLRVHLFGYWSSKFCLKNVIWKGGVLSPFIPNPIPYRAVIRNTISIMGIFRWRTSCSLWELWLNTYSVLFCYRYKAYDKTHSNKMSTMHCEQTVTFSLKKTAEHCNGTPIILCGFHVIELAL